MSIWSEAMFGYGAIIKESDLRPPTEREMLADECFAKMIQKDFDEYLRYYTSNPISWWMEDYSIDIMLIDDGIFIGRRFCYDGWRDTHIDSFVLSNATKNEILSNINRALTNPIEDTDCLYRLLMKNYG